MTDPDVLPEPLVAATVDLRSYPTMPLDVARLAQSWIAYGASAEAFRCAVLLWGKAWHQVPCGSLPDDDVMLAQYAGFGRVVGEWQKVRDEALHGFVRCSDGRLYHPVIAEHARRVWASKCEIEAGRAADRDRKQAVRHNRGADETASGGQFDFSGGQAASVRRTDPHFPAENALKESEGKGREASPSGFSGEKPSGSGSARPRATAPRGGAPLPPEFSVPQEWIEEARLDRERHNLAPAALATQAARFVRHFHAQAGPKGLSADWHEVWLNWALDARPAPEIAPVPTDAGGGMPETGDRRWEVFWRGFPSPELLERQSTWMARLVDYRPAKFWHPGWGPRPGENGCEAPPAMVAWTLQKSRSPPGGAAEAGRATA